MKAYFLINFLIKLPKFENQHEWWSLNVDYVLNKKGSATRVILEGPDDIILEQAFWFEFQAFNNQA